MHTSAYSGRSTVDQLAHFNTELMAATKGKDQGALKKLVLECLDAKGSTAGKIDFIAKLEQQGLYNKNLKFEQNMVKLISQLNQAAEKVKVKGDADDMQVLKAFSDNLTSLIQLAQSELTTRAQSSRSHLLATRNLSLGKAGEVLEKISSRLFAQSAPVRTSGEEKESKGEVSELAKKLEKTSLKDELTQYQSVFKDTLKVPINLQQKFHSDIEATRYLRKQKDAIAPKLTSFLSELEGVETEKSSDLTSRLKTYAGYGVQTEFGEAHTGGLARGVYSGIYNRLNVLNGQLEKAQSKESIVKCLSAIGAALIEAQHLLKVHEGKKNPQTQQAKRALMLMKLGEFAHKCDIYLTATGIKTTDKDAVATLNAYKRFIGCDSDFRVSPEKLQAVTTEQLNAMWDKFADSITSKPWADDWNAFIEKGSEKARSLKELAFEFISDLEALEPKRR
jgi:hypothetical protein